MQDKILQTLCRIIYRYPLHTILLVLLLTLAAGYLDLHLNLQVEITDLLPQHEPVIQDYFRAMEQFGMVEYMLLFLRSEEALQPEDLTPFLDDLAGRLSALPTLDFVDHRFTLQKSESAEAFLLARLPLFLTDEGFQQFMARLSREGIHRQLRKNRKLVLSGAFPGLDNLILRDPLALLVDFLGQYSQEQNLFNLDIVDGYYMTADRKHLFFLLKPNRPPTDLLYSRDLLTGIDDVVARVRASHADLSGIENLTIQTIGSHSITIAESRLIRRDIYLTALTSLFGVLLLFFIAFRRIRILLYVTPPLLVGVIWALAIGYLVIGHLNLLTSIVTALVLGLGIDFAIHLCNRYIDERAHGRSVQVALERSMVETGRGILIGAFTTAIAFYTMMLTDFKGVAEFGFMCGSGILCCLLSMFTLLPALLAWRERHRKKVFPYPEMTSFGLDRLAVFVLRHPTAFLTGGIIVTIFFAWQARDIRFNEDLRTMRSRSNPALLVQQEIKDLLGSTLKPLILMVTAKDEDQIRERVEMIQETLSPIVDGVTVSWIDSFERILPSPSRQKKNLQRLQDLRNKIDPEMIRTTFRDETAAAGFRYQPQFDTYVDSIIAGIMRQQQISFSEIDSDPLMYLLQRYVHQNGNQYTAALYLYAAQDLSNPEIADPILLRLGEALRSLSFPIRISGLPIITRELKHRITNAIKSVTTWVFIGVILVLWLYFRRWQLVLATLVPLTMAVIWVLGLMKILDLPFNYINIFVTPMILGIGIDDNIHMITRYREKGNRDLHYTIRHTGKSLLLTSLTTIVAFGSLSFADYEGLSSFGILAILGISFCFLTTILFLPPLIDRVVAQRTRQNTRSGTGEG